MIKKGLTIGGRSPVPKSNAFAGVVCGIEAVNIKCIAIGSIIPEIADVQVAFIVLRQVFPIGVFSIGNGFCIEQLTVQIDQIQFRFAAAVVMRPECSRLCAIGQPRTFRDYRRKLSYFTIFVMRFNFLKIIGSVIGLTGTEHRFDR